MVLARKLEVGTYKNWIRIVAMKVGDSYQVIDFIG